MDKLNIANEMRCFDRKDRGFYDSLTEEERRKFSNFLMIRWGSAVDGSRELQEFYVISTNERLNKNFFAINRHPKLQWLTATAVSPGMGSQRHNWIAPKKKQGTHSNKRKSLLEIYPQAKLADIEMLCSMMSDSAVNQLRRDHGMEK